MMPPSTVDHPPHYKSGGMEAIDVIEAFGLGFRLGNAVKYILRAGRKGPVSEDLKKAAWYLAREIGRLPPPSSPPAPGIDELTAQLAALERTLIERAYAEAGGVKTKVAKLLGIKTSALYYKLDKYGIGTIAKRHPSAS